MTFVLTIFALIIAMPLQMASISKAMVHLSEYPARTIDLSDHHHADHHHSDSQHQHDEEDQTIPAHGSATEHSHEEGGPLHSHAKEFSGSPIQVGMSRNEINTDLKLNSQLTTAQFSEDFFKDRITDLLVFRPPIQA